MSGAFACPDPLYLAQRVRHLEGLHDRTRASLEGVRGLVDLLARVGASRDVAAALAPTAEHLLALGPLAGVGFFLADDDLLGFHPRLVRPVSAEPALRRELDRQIDAGAFAWALRSRKPVLVPVQRPRAEPDRVLLCALATEQRVLGMFLGELQDPGAPLDQEMLDLLSIALASASLGIENALLYEQVHRSNEALERRVRERTRALTAAKEKAERATRTQERFLATVSHDLRTPMNGVLGFASLLLEGDLPPAQREHASLIEESAQALVSLLDDLVDYNRLQSGKIQLEQIPLDLVELACSVCALLRPRLSARPVELICHPGPDVPRRVLGDPTRLRQVLTNLVGNAAKFTDSGEIEITLSVDDDDDGARRLHLAVRDTGPGVPPDRIEAIFEVFEQAAPSTARRYGGTGLGLAISRHLARAMGGDCWAESIQGQGSTFHCTVSCAEPLPGEGAAETASLSDKRVALRCAHPTAQAAVAATLARLGARVLDASSSAPVPSERVDAIVVDAERLAGLSQPHDLEAPRIVLARDAEAQRSALAAGCAHVLLRPVAPDALAERILAAARDRDAAPVDEEHARKGPARKAAGPFPAPPGRTVLLVDDNAINRRLGTLLLRKGGYRAETASSGAEAIARVALALRSADAPLAAVLMDIQMPGMDGLQATRAIRAAERRAGVSRRLPVIAMTANADPRTKAACREAEMDDFVTKPARRERLFAALDRLLPERGATEPRPEAA